MLLDEESVKNKAMDLKKFTKKVRAKNVKTDLDLKCDDVNLIFGYDFTYI